MEQPDCGLFQKKTFIQQLINYETVTQNYNPSNIAIHSTSVVQNICLLVRMGMPVATGMERMQGNLYRNVQRGLNAFIKSRLTPPCKEKQNKEYNVQYTQAEVAVLLGICCNGSKPPFEGGSLGSNPSVPVKNFYTSEQYVKEIRFILYVQQMEKEI